MGKRFYRNSLKVLMPLLLISGFFIARSREGNWETINIIAIATHNVTALLFIVSSIIHTRVEKGKEKK